ncbi:Dihydrouridine synthase-like protein 2 [Elsinoe fawcettii]|nr:Dihydrouridine synthase-like protein 2 [Elsinoe fawcettii]
MAEASRGVKRKLHGRAFYESIGSPKYVLAPMVDQSEFAWRLLSRSFMPQEQQSSLLCYTPMFHARLFTDTPRYRDAHFQPVQPTIPFPYTTSEPASPLHLDGNPAFDRPLFVQFCANDPASFLSSAKAVSPYCDAVDLNLGCPQGIAKRGNYGAFLQEDWGLISKLIRTLHEELPIPVTAKMRILETKEKTLDYAKMILDSGASIITVHGRRREQKGHNTGLADWAVIRYLRESLPKDTVMFANGNVLQHGDIERCLEATDVDAVMSAEGNLYDPTIFGQPPNIGEEGREYWRGRDGKGGYRMDAVLRRYMDIIWRHVLGQEPPSRKSLFVIGDNIKNYEQAEPTAEEPKEDGPPPKKRQKRMDRKQQAQNRGQQKLEKESNPNLTAMQAHLFHMLRPLVAKHTQIRDKLAKTRTGDIDGYEQILTMVEDVVRKGLIEYEEEQEKIASNEKEHVNGDADGDTNGAEKTPPELDETLSSTAAIERCKRPWFVIQAHVRPLPKEAIEKGALQLSKKEKRKLEMEKEEAKKAGVVADGKVQEVTSGVQRDEVPGPADKVEVPEEGLVCG